MPFKRSSKRFLLIFSILLITGLSAYFLLKDRGRKKTERVITTSVESPRDSLIFSEINSFSYDLESPFDLENYNVSEKKARSGVKSNWLNKNNEYSVTVRKPLNSIAGFQDIKEIIFSFSLLTEKPVNNAVVVLSIDDPSGKSVEWIGKELKMKPDSWQQLDFSFEINKEKLNKDCFLKIYIWNKGKEDFFVDDFAIRINGMVSGTVFNSGYIPERNIDYDFEVPFEGENVEHYSQENAHSGKFSFLLNNSVSYSPSVVKKVSEVIDSEFKLITISVWLNQMTNDNEVVLVTTIRDQTGKEYFWQGRSTEKGKFPKGKWVKHKAQFKLPFEKIKPDDVIGIYVWNKGGNEVYIDDLSIVYGETNVRSGRKFAVDMTVFPDGEYKFIPNKPPFKTIYLSNFSNSTTENFLPDNFLPDDIVATGQFIKQQHGREQIIKLREGVLSVYSYCQDQKSIIKIGNIQSSELNIVDKDAFLSSGNYLNNNSNQLLIADLKKRKILLCSIEGLKNECIGSENNYVNLKVLASLSPKESIPFFNGKYNRILSGDFDGNGIKDILLINSENGGYSIFDFNSGSDVKILSESYVAAFKFPVSKSDNSINFIRSEDFKQDIIIVSSSENDHNKSVAFRFSTIDQAFISISNWNCNLISGNSSLYQGNFNSQVEVMILNKTWKFDMTGGRLNNQGISVESRMDFSGYLPGNNPKYFEDLKIITGKFTQNTRSELLVLAANCQDSNFPASPCSVFENTSVWKPVSQLYYFKD